MQSCLLDELVHMGNEGLNNNYDNESIKYIQTISYCMLYCKLSNAVEQCSI